MSMGPTGHKPFTSAASGKNTPAADGKARPLPATIPTRAEGGSGAIVAMPVTYEVLKDLGKRVGARARVLAADSLMPPAPRQAGLAQRVSSLVKASATKPSELAQVLSAVRQLLRGEYHDRGLGAALAKMKFTKEDAGFSAQYMDWLKDGKSSRSDAKALTAEFAKEVITMTGQVFANYEEVARQHAEKAVQSPRTPLVGKELQTCAYGLINQALDDVLPAPDPDAPASASPYALGEGPSRELHPQVRMDLLADFYTRLDEHREREGEQMQPEALQEMVRTFADQARTAIADGSLAAPRGGRR